MASLTVRSLGNNKVTRRMMFYETCFLSTLLGMLAAVPSLDLRLKLEGMNSGTHILVVLVWFHLLVLHVGHHDGVNNVKAVRAMSTVSWL